MSVVIFHVDAFASEPFSGNPAAVCVLDAPPEEAWMRHIAGEMNLPATAFVVRRHDGFDLRWFTPATELGLCGHATLASAHVLWETGRLDASAPVRFHTKSGLLGAERRDGRIELTFPSTPVEPVEAPAGLAEALGVTPRFVGRSKFDYLIEVDTEAAVAAVRPDFGRLRQLPVRGAIVTSRATTPGWDFVSRFFAPSVGIDEDAVTGSAHCALTPFWSHRLGTASLTARQLSRRGGTVHVRLDREHVTLAGAAVTIASGGLRV